MLEFTCPKCGRASKVKKILSEKETAIVFDGVEDDMLILCDREEFLYRPSYFCMNCHAEIPGVDCDQVLIDFIKKNSKV